MLYANFRRVLLSIAALTSAPAAAQDAAPPAPSAELTPTPHPATQQSVRQRDPAPRDPAAGVDDGDPRIDETTGRQVATWRKDRAFDFLSQRVELDIPDINTPVASGSTTITATPVAYAQSEMLLDSDGPLVTGVRVDGSRVRFAPADKFLRITLPRALAPGQATTVTVEYTLDFSAAKGEGLTWCAPRENSDSESSLVPMIHAQGEAELNSRWFPCFDSPEERLTSEVIVTCDSDFTVVSNGVLVEQAAASPGHEGRPRTLWHWKQDKPHAPYLITLGIGKWSIIEVGGDGTARPGLPMPVYALKGQEEDVAKVFASTPRNPGVL